MVEHPVRDDAVELAVCERKLPDVCDARVETAFPGQLDHARGDVHGRHLGVELVAEPRCELTPAAADLEHALGGPLRNCRQRRIRRHGQSGALVDRPSGAQAVLGRVLPPNQRGIVQSQGSTIGCPGSPRLGAFPPSQALTVAPTSANSPSSWILPAALRPWT